MRGCRLKNGRNVHLQVMTFDGWVDHLLREMLAANTDDWFRVRAVPARVAPRERRVPNNQGKGIVVLY